MTEDYLQYIWANKRVPLQSMKLSDGREMTVHNVGNHNDQYSGPDFTFGSVSIEGVRLYGNIEIHVNSSDWIKHKHHHDRAYDNVILHVVLNYDIDIIQNGVLLPTLELKSIIDIDHYERFIQKKIKDKEFPCETSFSRIDSIYFESMKHHALVHKLKSKVRVVVESGLKNENEVFYHLVGLAFGSSVNKLAFTNLLEKVPYTSLRLLRSRQKYNLLVSESGVYQSGNSNENSMWNFKGTRPSNFPTKRIKEFAVLCERFDFETSFLMLPITELISSFRQLIKQCYIDRHTPLLTRSFENHILVNAVVPLLWYLGEANNDEQYFDKGLEVLNRLTSEKNRIIRRWEKLGVKPNSAFDSQGMLALHRYYCCHKKCLSCAVGNKILNR